jgi:hypothetical protein
MARVTIDGIALDLPAEPTPVRLLEPVLIRAWLRWRPTRGTRYDPKLAGVFWPELLFYLWGTKAVEFVARHGEPDAPQQVIDFPQPERLWSRFSLRALIPYGQLTHEPTRRRFFDLCIRPTATAAGTASVEPAATPLTREQAVQQIIDDGKTPGSPDYPVKAFVAVVWHLCGVGETARGFDRRTLQRLFNNLKNRTY